METKRILAVSSRADDLRRIQASLEPHGYEVQVAGDGVDALARLKESPPDLLVLDAELPGITGFEVVDAVRHDPSLVHLLVIVLLDKKYGGRVAEGYGRGADMYLTQPFNSAELAAFVRRILTPEDERRGSRARPGYV